MDRIDILAGWSPPLFSAYDGVESEKSRLGDKPMHSIRPQLMIGIGSVSPGLPQSKEFWQILGQGKPLNSAIQTNLLRKEKRSGQLG